MDTNYIDLNMLKQHYTRESICTKQLYVHTVPEYTFNEIFTYQTEKYVIIHINPVYTIIGFNINSSIITEGYVRVCKLIVSHFTIIKGTHSYPHLILSNYRDVTLLLERNGIIKVEMMTVRNFDDHVTNLLDQPCIKKVKINDFGPMVTFGTNCVCGMRCRFSDSDDCYVCQKNITCLISDINVKNIHPLNSMSKVKGICERVIILYHTGFMVKDMLVHIGTIMFFCV